MRILHVYTHHAAYKRVRKMLPDVQNGFTQREIGLGFCLTEYPGYANIDDCLLNVTLLGKVSCRRLLQSFPEIFLKDHISLDEVETFQAKRIRIMTDVANVLTPGGELIGTTPVDVECLHQIVEVFVA